MYEYTGSVGFKVQGCSQINVCCVIIKTLVKDIEKKYKESISELVVIIKYTFNIFRYLTYVINMRVKSSHSAS